MILEEFSVFFFFNHFSLYIIYEYVLLCFDFLGCIIRKQHFGEEGSDYDLRCRFLGVLLEFFCESGFG